VRFESEPLRLERDRPTASKGIEDGGRVAIGRAADLCAHLVEESLVAEVVPVDHPSDEVEQTLALGVDARGGVRGSVLNAAFLGLGAVLVEVLARVVDKLREEHGARGRERATSPPQVQRRGVPVTDRLLARGLRIDRLERQRDLDQLLLGHQTPQTRTSGRRARVEHSPARDSSFLSHGHGFVRTAL